MTTVRVRIPAPSSMLVANVLGVLCLLGIAMAVGGLTHNGWWALLAASIEGLAFAAVWTQRLDDVEQDGEAEETTALTRAA